MALCLFGRDIREGGMKPLTIIVSFDVGEQVVWGGVPGFVTSLVHDFGFQTAETAFHRCVVPIKHLPAPSGAYQRYSPFRGRVKIKEAAEDRRRNKYINAML